MDLINKDNKISKEFFQFLKYNIINNSELSENDNEYYDQFISKISRLESALKNKDSSSASEILGSIMSMFGYSRHYCAMSGQPIIGKYFKIDGRPVSKTAYESYKIVQQMERFDNRKVDDSKKHK